MTFTDEDLKELKEHGLDCVSCQHMRIQVPKLIARLEVAENCFDSLTHETDCILSFWEAGEPTADGGYRAKFAGKWYQSRPVDETPKCDCGLDVKFDAWHKAAGK